MPPASQSTVDALTAAGLYVRRVWPAEHVFPDGIFISQPTDAELAESEQMLTESGISILPGRICLRLYFTHDCWVVDGLHSSGGMGPTDFVNRWTDEESAIADILKFFGHDERWQAVSASHQKHL